MKKFSKYQKFIAWILRIDIRWWALNLDEVDPSLMMRIRLVVFCLLTTSYCPKRARLFPNKEMKNEK